MTYHPFISAETGEPYGSFETFLMSAADVAADWQTDYGFAVPYGGPCDPENDSVSDPAELAGWYWAAGFPGCLWDGDPMGPFPTEQDAIDDANSHV